MKFKCNNAIMIDQNPSRNPAVGPRAGSVLIFFLLAGLLALATPLRAQNPPTYLYQIDASTVPGGYLPIFVTLDASNNVYVTDTLSNRVVKFAAGGAYLAQWGSTGSGNGQLDFPYGIAVDSSNDVYVADIDNSRVEKFDSNGTYLTQWGSYGAGNGQFIGLTGVAVDSNSNVYVSDGDNQRIEKFDRNGNYLAQWGSFGTGNGQFNDPAAVAVDSNNNVYVVDVSNNRIEKFDSNGNYLAQWGGFGAGSGQFNGPAGVAVDINNIVYVSDANMQIEKFDSNGNYLSQWGTNSGVDGPIFWPRGIAVDSSGNIIYVVDIDDARILVFANNINVVAPIITNEPASQTVPAGVNLTISVGVVGGAPFGYQWNSNNVALAGATNATFTLTHVGLTDAGVYSVLVTNNFGSAWSSNALLTVLPALVTTLPANGISGAGAVLNGSVTVGPDQTAAWFEWGTDTNYGQIAGLTNLSGDSGQATISNVLGGLNATLTYHYKLVASNSFGIIYGGDQSFTVGLAPSATTLAAVVNTNGATLNTSVNPNGWDTTVYFRWGTTSLTNFTPKMDVGAGATPLHASSVIPVVQAEQYYFQVVASNYLGTAYGAELSFFTPPFTGVPLGQWQSVAASADGTKLIAGAAAGPGAGVYVSTNRGATWTVATNTINAEAVASSADVTKLIAAVYGKFIYISTNSGATWVHATNAPAAAWNAVASSADGTKLAAVVENGSVFTSTNSGVHWTRQTNGLPASTGFTYIASSADGSKLVMAGSPIFTSTNVGINWTKATNAPLATWYSVASAADGTTLLACAYNSGYVYLSTNAGVIWTKTSLPAKNWNSVAESADGTRMVALANSGSAGFGAGSGGIFTSTDSGATWVSNSVPSWSWTCAAMSADGNEIIATIGGASSTGTIYVSQASPSPVLNLSASDNVISWLIPSLDFTLQQSPDLSSWTDMTNLPVLNLTNLQNQVVLPPPGGNSFFRLIH
jgi:sugar lactone lactonase YvrE